MNLRIIASGLLSFITIIVAVDGIPNPTRLNSDLTIAVHNDLSEGTTSSNSSNPGILLLDEKTWAQARTACLVFGEDLWNGEGKEEVAANLAYLVYSGQYEERQQYWVSRRRTVDAAGRIQNEQQGKRLPVLCTQSAPYSTMPSADGGSYPTESGRDNDTQWRVSVNSNNRELTGFRDRFTFQFLGVRYAEKPARWAYPRVYVGHGEKTSALDYGSVCAQSGMGSEDCLFLNIWSPFLPRHGRRSQNLKAVMLWIHGGAFTSGTGSDPTFDGTNLASRGDVVVVTINYRLGPLGFLVLGDEGINGNFGLADQITALDWVRENIRDFGGDPDRITIFGQSAGAMSVRALLASPEAIGKFAYASLLSDVESSTDPYMTIEQASASVGALVLKATNCSDVACLRGLPQTMFDSLWSSRPIIDGQYITVPPNQTLNGGGPAARVPVLIGLMRNDNAGLSGYPSANDTLTSMFELQGLPNLTVAQQRHLFPNPTGPNSTLNLFNASVRASTDGSMRCASQAIAYAGTTNSIFPETYMFEFNRSYQLDWWSPNYPVCEPPATEAFPNGDPSLEYFKCHSGELYYLFGNVLFNALPLRDASDLPFEQLIVDSWSSFARTGNPNPDLGFLLARNYTSTAGEVRRGHWNPVSKGSWNKRILAWPSVEVGFDEAPQCDVLGLPIDAYA
ncbi:cholinesterase [Aspergillus californicus]